MRILIVDDSALIRSMVKSFLTLDEQDFLIAGEASNGERAIEMNRKLDPDFIIMDINMPIMDGLEATRRIMQEKPVPILIFSNEIDAEISYKAINNGAIDVMRKPDIDQFNHPEFYQGFLRKIRLLTQKQVGFASKTPAKISHIKEGIQQTCHMVVIGASTGGPAAVREVLRHLPGHFPVGIVLVQHLEKGFDQGYAHWLNDASALNVRLVEKTEEIQPHEVFVAPVDKHLIIHGNRIRLDDGPRVLFQKPSVDVLFESAANVFGNTLLGILLTGMGRDGATGCVSIVSKGGFTLVQDRATSAIFGMPKAAIEMGGASKILPLQGIIEYLIDLAGE